MEFVPFFVFDGVSTLFEQIDNVGIFEGKGGQGDFDMFNGLIFEAQIRQLESKIKVMT